MNRDRKTVREAMDKVLRTHEGAFAALAAWDLRHTAAECCDPRTLCPDVSVVSRGQRFVATCEQLEGEGATEAEALAVLGAAIDVSNLRKLRGG